MFTPINYLICNLNSLQDQMYYQFHKIAEKRPIQSLALVLPISVLDIGSDIIKPSLFVIDRLGKAAIEMFSALWSSELTLKNSVQLLEYAAFDLILIPVALVFAPIRVAIQVVAIIRDPIHVRPFSEEA